VHVQHEACDILIIGGGGAALYAAIRARDANPKLRVVVASKGLFGKSGCTRMVQGGYNVVLNPNDSFDKHYDDTLRGGGMINNQDLAWTLVTQAPDRIIELENRFGCYFDRNADGTIHQRALAGQSFNRTVHRGDLTGIELMSRLAEQVLVRDIEVLNEVRGVDLLFDANHERVCGALLLDTHRGTLICIAARAVLLATGGAAPLYRITPASLEKSGDGLAMGFRAGAEFVDMEMMQFHPTGLIAGDSVMTGTVLEEGLRGAGGHLLNAHGERFMARYDPAKMERSTRDRVARSSFMEIRAGRGTAQGGVLLDVRHLGKEFLLKSSPGMYKRCLSIGCDMATEPIQVTPTAHFQMGGMRIDTECRTSIPGLYAAGEDAGGVHGANRLGGNGVAESIVFGGVAGDAMIRYLDDGAAAVPAEAEVKRIASRLDPRAGDADPFALRRELGKVAWDRLGIIRSAESLGAAEGDLDRIEEASRRVAIPSDRAGDGALHERLNLENLITVARLIRVSALLREESRGSHYREDFPDTSPRGLYNIYLSRAAGGSISTERRPVTFTRRRPEDLQGDTVIPTENVTTSATFTTEI
jgi:succinate dehydrogenase / fumarate reductase flavoprotein subunit/fumarate reductase flavoprotein subunit